MKYILWFWAAYLCGSIPFGKLMSRLHGVDIQKRGSGNIGFANVQRVLGWRASLPTLLGDILKGLLPTWLAVTYVNQSFAFWVGLVAIVGHIFPAWLRFRGGKGIATGLGVLLVLQPLAAAIGSLIYLVGRLTIKNSGWSSLIGIVGITIAGSIRQPDKWWEYVSLLALAIWTLRHNIAGTVPNYDI